MQLPPWRILLGLYLKTFRQAWHRICQAVPFGTRIRKHDKSIARLGSQTQVWQYFNHVYTIIPNDILPDATQCQDWQTVLRYGIYSFASVVVTILCQIYFNLPTLIGVESKVFHWEDIERVFVISSSIFFSPLGYYDLIPLHIRLSKTYWRERPHIPYVNWCS